MSTSAAEAPRGILEWTLRERAGWAVMALACIASIGVVTLDAGRGSLDMGLLQALLAFGLFVVAICAKGFATGQTTPVVPDLTRTGAVSLQLLVPACSSASPTRRCDYSACFWKRIRVGDPISQKTGGGNCCGANRSSKPMVAGGA